MIQDASSNTKYLWAYLGLKTNNKKSIIRLEKENRNITEDDGIIAEEKIKALYVREDNNLTEFETETTFQGPKLQEVLLTKKCVKNERSGWQQDPGSDGSPS